MLESFSKDLFEKLSYACSKCQSDTISLSGGLDSTIIAYHLKDRKPKSIAITVKEFKASDLIFCQMAAKWFELPLKILQVETAELLEAVEKTISILRNFNDIEIRNNVVMYLALKWAKENGASGVITGDGADELFAGYSFLIKKSEKELEKELQRIHSVMHFPTQKIGKSIGINIESPFLDKEIIDMALQIPGNYKIHEENEKKFGKWILRKTYETRIPPEIAWRDKSPMQDGSGTNYLTQFFENMIKDIDFMEKKKKIEKDSGIKIRTKESIYYFEIFKDLFGVPEKFQGKTCPYCLQNSENSKFCRMCGAFPI